MFDFLTADMRRVLKKRPYIVLTSIVLVMFAAALLFVLSYSPEDVGLAGMLLRRAAVVLIGVPVYTAVFTDDFNSKAMQTIIGYGNSRKKLVLSRYFEYLVLLGQAFLAITLLSVVMCAAFGHIGEAAPLLKELWHGYLLAALSVCVSMIFVYGTQNPTLGLVVFISLIMDVFDLLLTGVSFIPFFMDRGIDLSIILPSNLLGSAFNNGRTICLLYAAVAYIVVPLIISVTVFEKKELEF